MTRFRISAALAAMVAFVGFVAADDKAEKKDDKKVEKFDAAKLVGKWEFVSGSKAGEKVDVSKLKDAVEFTKDTIVMPTAEGKFEFKYTVDGNNIELEITAPEAFKGSKAPGIVKFDGENLLISYPSMGGDRPKDYDAKKDSGNHSFTLKKVKGEKKEEKKDK